MEIAKLIEMFSGQDGEKHDLEVSLTDIRRWHTEIERLRAALREIAEMQATTPWHLTAKAMREMADNALNEQRTTEPPKEQKHRPRSHHDGWTYPEDRS